MIMMTNRYLIFLFILFGFIVSCGKDSSNVSTSNHYSALITFDESQTTVQLVRLGESEAELPSVFILFNETKNYSILPYMIGRGSVPDWEKDVLDYCNARDDLGIDEAGPCGIQPLLNSLENIAVQLGIGIDEIFVDISYNTNGSPQYAQAAIDSLDETINQYIAMIGYTSDTEQIIGYDPGAYTHQEYSGIDNPNWMSRVDSNVTLSRITIPGTHDTMSHYGGDIVQTQSMRLREQLKSGIRALDIRCRHFNDSFSIHHGSVYQKANFDDVLLTLRDFLNANPTETVVMRVKEEYNSGGNTRSFAATFDRYVGNYPGLFWKYDGNNNPLLGQIRGKIVLLQDFPADNPRYPQAGIPWSSAIIQDDYYLRTNWDLHDKWVKVERHLHAADNGDRNKIYINFLSGSGGSLPYFVASGKSSPGDTASLLLTGVVTTSNEIYRYFPRVSCIKNRCSIAFLGTNFLTKDRLLINWHAGIVMADFPGQSLINQLIYGCNYHLLKTP